jgi:hypothetical protein
VDARSVIAGVDPALKLACFPQKLCDPSVNGAYAFAGDRRHNTCRGPQNRYRKSAKNSRSGLRQTFNPVQGPKDIGITAKITFARGNTENVAAVLVSDGAPDTLREKRKLLFRRLFACSAGPPVNLGSAFAGQSLFLFRSGVPSGPSFDSNSSVRIKFRFTIGHDISSQFLNMN